MHIIALSLLLASGPPALRTVDTAWEVVEVRGANAHAGERSAPLNASSRRLAELLADAIENATEVDYRKR